MGKDSELADPGRNAGRVGRVKGMGYAGMTSSDPLRENVGEVGDAMGVFRRT